MLHRLFPAVALAALPLLAAGCSADARYSASGTSADSDGYAVTGGGYEFATDEPSYFYGTVADPSARRYTYLVITKDLLGGELVPNQTSEGGSSSDGKTLSTDHKFTVNGFGLSAAFEATVGDTGLEGQTLTINGTAAEPGQWLFVSSAKDPNAPLVPVDAEMPELPMELEGLNDFTRDLATRLSTSNEAVKDLLAGS